MRLIPVLAATAISTAGQALAAPQPPVRASVQITAAAAVEERTALTVSAQAVTFVVPPGAAEATAALHFTAGVRTQPGREVLLVGRASGAPGLTLRFAGAGEGQASGPLAPDDPAIVARWSGGGLREGRIVFTLEAAPGVYTVPIQLTISVP